jgi:hypothetical protein
MGGKEIGLRKGRGWTVEGIEGEEAERRKSNGEVKGQGRRVNPSQWKDDEELEGV